jgi:DNA invertase Pin-like site-specific DNA recombinase
VAEVYKDAGISGAKGRDQRPGLDVMLKDAGRRKFDVVMVWAIDRLGRSLIGLLSTIQHLEACGVDLYLDQQSLDATTPMGKLLFQVTGAFAEFERTMIRQRVNAGLGTIKAKLKREGRFTSKGGIVRSRLGRPGAEPEKITRARVELAKGVGIGKVARLTGLGTGTVHKLKRTMAAAT